MALGAIHIETKIKEKQDRQITIFHFSFCKYANLLLFMMPFLKMWIINSDEPNKIEDNK